MDDEDTGFEKAWSLARTIEGWLTREQAAVLHRTARALPPGGVIVEIGSHCGRSTVIIASGLAPGCRLLAVDPFDPGWRYGRPDTRERLLANLATAGVGDRVELLPTTSHAGRSAYRGTVDAVYVDGKHDARTVLDDLRWAERLPPSGPVLVHDAFSSVGVTLALLGRLPLSTRLAYTGRTGSLARLEARRPTPRERLRPLVELPWWMRNLLVKVLLRARLRIVARWLGHDSPADPF